MSAFVNSIGEKETMEVEIAFALQLLRFVHSDSFSIFSSDFNILDIDALIRLYNVENSKHIWWISSKFFT